MKMLKLDIDFHPPSKWLSEWLRTRFWILHNLRYSIEYSKLFKTKRGFHLYIKLNQNVSDEMANMLQFLLGDDHTRVKINQWRIKRGIKHWNKLFHKVLYRRKAKVLTCYYCGNKIPVPDRWFKEDSSITKQEKPFSSSRGEDLGRKRVGGKKVDRADA